MRTSTPWMGKAGRWAVMSWLAVCAPNPASAESASDLVFSRVDLDATQATATLSYPSSLIQSRWDVYSAPATESVGTGGWAQVASGLILTGTESTVAIGAPGAQRYFTVGLQTLDSDGDGLSDAYEQLVSHTDPQKADTDGDGLNDGDEVLKDRTDPLDPASCRTQSMLTAAGTVILDGAGNPVLLRGVSLGGWLVYEQWMVACLPSSGTSAQDDYSVRATLDSRFASTGTTFLLNLFRDHYFTTADMDDLKADGCNFLRVPFLDNLLEDETNTYHYKDSGWARLDWVVSNCAARQMYCLLDLHGAPGCQNPWDHSGRVGYDQLWSGTDYQARAVALWSAIAQRYATNAAVAGYDLLNEPFYDTPDQLGFFTNNIIPMYRRLYNAIRAEDQRHLVFVESTEQLVGSNDACWWMPNPASVGWSNVVYEFHHYDGVIGSNNFSFAYQKDDMDGLVRRYADFGAQYQVPVYLGEFNSITPQNMDYFLRQCDANGISWTYWNYKHWGDWIIPQQPWSAWGLYYSLFGSNATNKPNILSDSWNNLVTKFTQYDHASYGVNPHLLDVTRRAAGHPDHAAEKTDFYVNTFTAHDESNRTTPDDAWPWLKLATTGGNDYSYVLTNHHGRLLVDWGSNMQMRLKSRVEADARFEVNDATGCWFSVELHALPSNAGVQLAAMRDAVTGAVWWAVSPGIIARAVSTNSQFQVQLFAKHGIAAGFGSNLFTSAALSFVAGAPLALFVNATNAILQYNGTNEWTGAHGLDFDAWANGAAGIIEADNLSGGLVARTPIELDTITAWRPGAAWSGRFDDDFAEHPDLLDLLAVPDHWSLQDFGNTNGNEDAYFSTGRVVVVPQREDWGIAWLNPRCDFGNALRYSPSNGAVEIRATLGRYTNGAAKLCFTPEYVPRETYWLYDGPFLFAEIRDQPGGMMLFHIFRQQAVGDIVSCASNFVPYAAGQCFSFQVTPTQAAIYYGTNLVVSGAHGLTNFAQAFPYGLYPHMEFQNYDNQNGASYDNGVMTLGPVLIRPLPGFTPPE